MPLFTPCGLHLLFLSFPLSLQVFPEQHQVQVEPALPVNDIVWTKEGDSVIFCTEAGDIWVCGLDLLIICGSLLSWWI